MKEYFFRNWRLKTNGGKAPEFCAGLSAVLRRRRGRAARAVRGRRTGPSRRPPRAGRPAQPGRARREDALRRLAQIAFGRANDCVRLVLEDDPPIGELDLTLLSEVKRSEKGAIEVRLADRIRALEELLQAGAADDGAAAAFFAAVEEP